MILRAEQGPVTSPSTGVLPGGGGGRSWLQPAPGTSVPAERLCYCCWVWTSVLGERDKGRLSYTLVLTAFSLMRWGSGWQGIICLSDPSLVG